MSIQGNPFVIHDSSLVIHADAANSKSYIGSGTKVYDMVSGYAHTLQGGASYTTLNGVQCFNCNTSGYYIECDTTGPILSTTGYTYNAWARLLSTNTEWRTLFRTTPDDHPLLIETGGTSLGMYDNNVTGFNNSGYNISSYNSIWAMWTIIGDTTNGTTFYINASKVGNTVAQSAGGNYHKWIGGAAGSQPFGYIANFSLHSRKLTVEEIFQNYNAVKSRFGL